MADDTWPPFLQELIVLWGSKISKQHRRVVALCTVTHPLRAQRAWRREGQLWPRILWARDSSINKADVVGVWLARQDIPGEVGTQMMGSKCRHRDWPGTSTCGVVWSAPHARA